MNSGPAPDPGKPSDQLPEEAPTEVVHDDVPEAAEGAARESGRELARQANERNHGPGQGRDRD